MSKKQEVELKDKKHRGAFLWLLGVSVFSVAVLLACQFFFVDSLNNEKTFMPNTTINGIDVSGLTQKQAENIVAYNLLSTRDEVGLNLNYKDKNWAFKGSDFEIANNIEEDVKEAFEKTQGSNYFERKELKKQAKEKGLNLNISYKNVLGGIDQKIEEVILEIEQDSSPAEVVFNPESDSVFSIKPAKPEIKVDREKLFNEIDMALATSKTVNIEIPTIEIETDVDESEILSRLGLRSRFSTNYSKSSTSRKSNIKRALSNFNGMILKPLDIVSFNETTGPRTEENGYKKANIILNGVYVEGSGGGVCQASTTLYNALLLGGIDVIEVSHHSLPASYVPLSLDAMVSEGSSDMVFKNNLEDPVYIKTYGTENEAVVEVYGVKFDEGVLYKTRAELVKVLPHGGDKIIPDSTGEYSNYVVYKGEYHRVKYPREGYESKAYLQILKDGEVVEEREIRHDYYYPQEGIIVEGVEDVTDGITIPQNTVKFIPPQKELNLESSQVKSKLEKENPSAFNP